MKTYKLTQEQIERLAEKKHAKELLQEFLPEAFETKLEVGKWYHVGGCNGLMFWNNRNDTYGFFNGNFRDDLICGFDYVETARLATEEEVREALINEAKKRGFNNIGNLKIKNIYGGISNGYQTITNDFNFDYKSNTFRLDGAVIFNNGKWAEIIEETNTFDKDYLYNKITEIYSLLEDIK